MASRKLLPCVTVLLSLVVGMTYCDAAKAAKRGRDQAVSRAELKVEFDQRAGKSTPVRMDVDFDALLPSGKSGLIDPHTIVVKRRLGGKTRTYNVRFSKDLYYKNQGWEVYNKQIES